MHRSVRRWLTVIVGTATLVSCSDIFGPGSARSDLDANRQKWIASGFTTYTFRLSMDCFCAVNGPVSVFVRSDSVVQATQTSNGEAVDPRFIPTITKLFDIIDRGIRDHAAVLRVTYDPTLGFPSEIVYDGSLNVVDDEVTYTASSVVLPPIVR